MALEDLLALLPDNDTGDIDAADLRTIVTDLWNRGTGLEARIARLEMSALGATTPSVVGFWQVNPQAGQVPGGQQVTADTSAWTDASWLRFAKQDQSNTDFSIALLGSGFIFAQMKQDSSNWARFFVDRETALPVDEGSYIQVPVLYMDGGGSIASAGWQAGAFVITKALE